MATIELTVNDWPDDLPLLTEVVDEGTPDDFPTLTEIATPEAAVPAPAISASSVFSEEEMQQLLHRLEVHLDTVVADKLKLHLEHLHEQAVAQTLSELKAGLPVLLQEALNAHLKSN